MVIALGYSMEKLKRLSLVKVLKFAMLAHLDTRMTAIAIAFAAVIFVSQGQAASDESNKTTRSAIRLSGSLVNDLTRFDHWLRSGSLNRDNCSQVLPDVFQAIRMAKSGDFDQSEIRLKAKSLIQQSWKMRQELRAWLKIVSSEQPVSQECLVAVRNVYRASRFIEDYLVDPTVIAPDGDYPKTSKILKSPAPLLKAGQKAFDSKTDLKSGDVLLSRGDALTSAAIARLGDIDAQFSHAALVYVDPDTQKIYTIEAHIEFGVVVAEFSKYLDDGKVRSALFRQSDEELGARAGKIMYDYANRKKAKTGENIHYDFGLNLRDHKTVFCSEVVNMAYEAASKGQYIVPQVNSRLDELSRTPFLKDLGVSEAESFLPGDLEMDTRFELIAEWRDHLKMRETHLKDALLTKMYEWMMVDNYALDPHFKAGILAKYIVHTIRQFPLFGKLFADQFPKYMPRTTLETIVVLQQAGEPILKELDSRETDFWQKTQRRMSASELYSTLEDIKSADRQNYLNGRKTVFHKYFHN